MSDFIPGLAARPVDALAGWRGAQQVSHGELLARCAAWRALALRTPGADVALFIHDSVEFAAALLGAWQAGKTVWLSADTLDASCRQLAARVDAFFGEFPPTFAPLLPSPGEECPAPWQNLDPSFAALVVHTSGSTGAPQAVPKRLSQLTCEVATLEALFGGSIGHADIIATVSHHHIYGLLFKVLWPLAAGRAMHAASLDYPEQLATALAARPCVLVASPAHLKRLPAHLDWQGAASQLRAVFSSGGALPAEAAVLAARLLGRPPIEIYGSSESGGIAYRRRAGVAHDAWTAMTGVDWRIAAGGGLEVRSPHLDTDGWMGMPDRAEALGGGQFMLLGRADRIVKIEEKRVSLDALEAALVASGLAREAKVVLCPAHDGSREVLAAFVVPSGEGAALLAGSGKLALNKRLRAHLAGLAETVALPRRWRYLAQMPVNAQGKTTLAQLLALLGTGLEAAPRLPTVHQAGHLGERVVLLLSVAENLLYFDGHFNEVPILPGVVQVDWAIRYGRQYFSLPPVFRGINALKFQQVIRPGSSFSLELVHDAATGTVQFRYFSDAGPHAGGRILFGS